MVAKQEEREQVRKKIAMSRQLWNGGGCGRRISASRVAAGRWDERTARTLLALAGLGVHARMSAWMRSHPMAGGTARVRVDRLSEYLPLRRRMFDLERAPLPQSLTLSRADQEINRTARLGA